MHDSKIELVELSNSVYQNEQQLNISTLQTCFFVVVNNTFFSLNFEDLQGRLVSCMWFLA